MAKVVLECRELGVIHGDVKDENILVNVVKDRPEIQLIDFGSGAHYTGEVFTEFGGTVYSIGYPSKTLCRQLHLLM